MITRGIWSSVSWNGSRRDGRGEQVGDQVGVVGDAVLERGADPAHQRSSTPASIGRFFASRAVARATRASTYAGRLGTTREGGGMSSCTCL